MVRSLVGTMVEVGRGKAPATVLAELLESHARHQAGPTAPPQGLYLVEVFYENEPEGGPPRPPPQGADALMMAARDGRPTRCKRV